MNLQLIKQLCNLKTNNLKKVLEKYLREKGYKPRRSDTFLIAEGELPICLIAHMDTVFQSPPRQFFYDEKKSVLWSPSGSGFDDRAGIYAILSLVEVGYRPSIIFTDLEEDGGIGAQNLVTFFHNCPFKDCRALIELDRANKNDCVFYNCTNLSFIKFIENFGFETKLGTFSDISIIAPVWHIAAVNLSVGYYLEHTLCEYLNCNELEETIKKVGTILDNCKEMNCYIYMDKIIDSSEDDIFSNNINFNECLFCGIKKSPHINMHLVNDPGCSYVVCDTCYNTYFNEEDKENIIDFFKN